MTTWVLILFLHAGIMSSKDSMAVTSVAGFSSRAECEAAGADSARLSAGTTKSVRWVCVKQTGVAREPQ